MSSTLLFKYTDLGEDKGQAIIRDMKTNFLKRRTESTIQMEFLQRQMSSLDGTRKKAELRITKRIKELKENAEYLEKEQARINNMGGKLAREKSVILSLGDGSRPVSRKVPVYGVGKNKLPNSILKQSLDLPTSFSRSCKFDQQKETCKSFPCAPCVNYTNLGFFSTDDRSDVQSVTRGLSARTKSKLWHDVESSSVLKPLRLPYNKCIKQESALQKHITHMREKHKEAKPKDWSVRYGEGTPLRKMLKPARL